ncbi:MAG: NAD-dependent dehydratase [Bacteriovoracaceae bacterium]|nr:NAD-dependent dehydratase [Bacteriovoracaceae bacterium]
MDQKSVIVCGAGGFIGSHLVKRLKSENRHVVGVDLKFPEFSKSAADLFLIGDLRDPSFCERLFRRFKVEEIFQLAADTGGAGYIFSGEHDAEILKNSSLINLNILDAMVKHQISKIFFASSASVNPDALENNCDFEKLFSERLYLSHAKNYGIEVSIARLHNIFGSEENFRGGKERVLPALCRKIIEAKKGDEIEVWGDGQQTRNFLFIDECIEGIMRLTKSEFRGPVNLGSSESVSIHDALQLLLGIAERPDIRVRYIDGPVGVHGRNADHQLIYERLGWAPSMQLLEGLRLTYAWISEQIQSRSSQNRRADSSPLVGEMFYDFFR